MLAIAAKRGMKRMLRAVIITRNKQVFSMRQACGNVFIGRTMALDAGLQIGSGILERAAGYDNIIGERGARAGQRGTGEQQSNFTQHSPTSENHRPNQLGDEQLWHNPRSTKAVHAGSNSGLFDRAFARFANRLNIAANPFNGVAGGSCEYQTDRAQRDDEFLDHDRLHFHWRYRRQTPQLSASADNMIVEGCRLAAHSPLLAAVGGLRWNY